MSELLLSRRKLAVAGLMMIVDDEGSAEIDRALFDAVTGGRFWPEYEALWRVGGVWREPRDFSREVGAALTLFRFALPDFCWLMRSDDERGVFANIGPREFWNSAVDGPRYRNFAATPALALCKSTIDALIAIEEARA